MTVPVRRAVRKYRVGGYTGVTFGVRVPCGGVPWCDGSFFPWVGNDKAPLKQTPKSCFAHDDTYTFRRNSCRLLCLIQRTGATRHWPNNVHRSSPRFRRSSFTLNFSDKRTAPTTVHIAHCEKPLTQLHARDHGMG